MKKLFLLALVCSACSQNVVRYVNDRAKFDRYETFLLTSTKVDSKNLSKVNSQILKELKKEIQYQMNRRDYQESNIGPDLILRYELASTVSGGINRPTNNLSPFYSAFPIAPLNFRSIFESVLILELFDKNRKLIWQASYDLEHERREERTIKVISKAVERAFTTYPYRAKQRAPDETLYKMEKKRKR
ncbi:MAG: DUF4136 domain-containing protein [Bacteroidota bacterium]